MIDEIEAGFPTSWRAVALARAFKILDPDLKHPAAELWQRSFQIFDLLL
jgi:hypothetical protein